MDKRVVPAVIGHVCVGTLCAPRVSPVIGDSFSYTDLVARLADNPDAPREVLLSARSFFSVDGEQWRNFLQEAFLVAVRENMGVAAFLAKAWDETVV